MLASHGGDTGRLLVGASAAEARAVRWRSDEIAIAIAHLIVAALHLSSLHRCSDASTDAAAITLLLSTGDDGGGSETAPPCNKTHADNVEASSFTSSKASSDASDDTDIPTAATSDLASVFASAFAFPHREHSQWWLFRLRLLGRVPWRISARRRRRDVVGILSAYSSSSSHSTNNDTDTDNSAGAAAQRAATLHSTPAEACACASIAVRSTTTPPLPSSSCGPWSAYSVTSSASDRRASLGSCYRSTPGRAKESRHTSVRLTPHDV